jgi:hypothetical protein
MNEYKFYSIERNCNKAVSIPFIPDKQDKFLAENTKWRWSNARLRRKWDSKVDLAEMGYVLDSCGSR